MEPDLRTDDFDYSLPAHLIAQTPADRREDSRLLVLDRARERLIHSRFAAIGTYLRRGDLVVANRSKVIPARLAAVKESGGAVELLLLRRTASDTWEALARPSRKLRESMTLRIAESSMSAYLVGRCDEGRWIVRFVGPGDIDAEIHRVGRLPLPPYIRNENAPLDRYQTVYADREGSVAAPTAGLHFSNDLLAILRHSGVEIHFVTLHVGLGTFRPVMVGRVADHRLHAEWGEVSSTVAAAVAAAKREGRRVVAVGTTTTRLLETAGASGQVTPFEGDTDRFIYPGYRFRVVDALVTNFHLPRSTLLMLVSALAGRDLVLRAYREAIEQQYRFYSFGDAMLIV